MTYGTSLERAMRLTKLANDTMPHPSNLESNRIVTRFETRAHAWDDVTGNPVSWGVWPRWRYADRPDLGSSFGGPFVPLADLEVDL